MKLKKQTITETIPALVYFVHGVRLSRLQQPCVSYGTRYNFQYTVACPSRFSYLIKNEKYHEHFYL
jgi:hypothetical protein